MVSRLLWCVAVLAAAVSGVAAQESDRVGFRASVSPDTIYVGQQATYALTVRIPADVRQRLRRNPEFVPPEARSMLAYELPLARSASAGEGSEVHTFRRALFVLTPGRYSIAPARLSYALPQSTSFFSREEERTLRSEGVSLVAIDPPLRGRPADWLGAVGSWRATARVEPADPRVGDPVVFTLRLEGEGNPTLLPRPTLVVPWADVVADDERVTLEAAPLMLGGAKEFTWLLTPRAAGTQMVASVEYAFFDPVARSYAVARSNPVTLRVRPGTLVAVPPRAAVRGDSLPLRLRPSLSGAQAPGLPHVWAWLAVAALAPLPWFTLRLRARRRRRAERPRADAVQGSARAMLERGIRERTGLELAQLTTPGALAAALRLEGVTAETARDVEALRDACERTAFAGGDARVGEAQARAGAQALLVRVAAEARRRALLVVALLTLFGCAGAGTGSERAVSAFAEGQTAYRGNDFERAREAFARAAAAAPRDPAVWTNLGHAAWQAGDTAMAVVGWQRALRLAPRDAELRDRLQLVRAPQGRGDARVWPIPPVWVAALALTCWLFGWWWAFAVRRSGGRSRAASLLLVPAVLLGGVAWYLETTLAARHLVVITEPTPLRTLPALGADQGALPLAGEVGAVLERREVWLRIRLTGGREGWYPTERTASLARD